MTNRIATGKKPVALTLNKVLLDYLDDLIRTGLYGSGHQQAIEELLRQRIRQLIDTKELELKHGELLDD